MPVMMGRLGGALRDVCFRCQVGVMGAEEKRKRKRGGGGRRGMLGDMHRKRREGAMQAKLLIVVYK